MTYLPLLIPFLPVKAKRAMVSMVSMLLLKLPLKGLESSVGAAKSTGTFTFFFQSFIACMFIGEWTAMMHLNLGRVWGEVLV